MKNTPVSTHRHLFLLLAFFTALSHSSAQVPGAQTIHETGQQYREGNSLMGASDNMAIGSQAMFEANLKAKKNIVDMKPNTFLSLWNNPAFAVQFEKFLSAPAETSADAKLYRQRIDRIMQLLSPGNATKANQDEAFNLLPLASEFESDANNCTTIHDAVYAAADAKVEIQKLTEVDQSLGKELATAQYNYKQSAHSLGLSQFSISKTEQSNNNANEGELRHAMLDPTKDTLASVKATIQRNQQQIANAEIQAKFALQSLILQLFVQRRYQHVIIIDRFYRALFDDGDQSLEQFERMADKMGYNKAAGQVKVVADANPKGSMALGSGNGGGPNGVGASAGNNGASVGNNGYNNNSGMDAGALSGSGLNGSLENLSVESMENAFSTAMRGASRTFKSLSQLDAFANEIIRDVNEGVKVYKFLLDKNEVESAASQLAAVFTKGEYLPSVRLLTTDDKRKTLAYAQLCNRLVNAANSGNIDALSDVVEKMKAMNPSFDDAEIRAKLQGVKTASSLLVAQARVAAAKGDLQAVQTEITRAAALWPNNPDVTNFSSQMGKMSERASPQVQAINDFDQLYGQKNFRQIFDEKEKYIAAIAQSPERQGKLKEVLTQMQEIETSIMRSQEIARRGDYAGAWEGLETTFKQYPDDLKLTQLRADYSTQVPDFIKNINTARQEEDKKEYGSALSWYLKAQNIYPMSDLTKASISRVVKQILPDAS
jgi:tetratricopeptide (TPR) repeat protein